MANHSCTVEELHHRLPGRWLIKATNFPMWLSGTKKHPSISYEVLDTDPLELSDLVEYRTSKGKAKSIRGIDTFKDDGFVWQGKGILKLLSSQWQVEEIRGDVAIIRFKKSLVTPAGMDVLVREGAEVPLREKNVGTLLQRFGISEEDFGSLCMLETYDG